MFIDLILYTYGGYLIFTLCESHMQTIVNTAFIHLHIIPNVIETRSTQYITHVTNMEKYTRMHSSKI